MPPRLSSRRAYCGRREQAVHDAAAVAQIVDGLEQRHDVDVERALARPQQPRFLEQHGDLQDVGDAVGLGDDVVGHGGLAVVPMRLGRGAQDRQLGGGLGGIGHERRGERAAVVASSASSRATRAVLGERRHSRCRGRRPPAARRRCARARRSSGAGRAPPDGSRRRRRRGAGSCSRPRASVVEPLAVSERCSTARSAISSPTSA